MDRKFQVYGGSLPKELIGDLKPTVYSLELVLRDSAVEYGDSDLPLVRKQNFFQKMRDNALDKAIRLYSGELMAIDKFSKDSGLLNIASLEEQCTGVMILSRPNIKPKTIWLANFGIRNDTLHYENRAVSGYNQTPKGSVNVEFIGYSPKE